MHPGGSNNEDLSTGSSYMFVGHMTEIRAWSTKRTATQIKDNMHVRYAEQKAGLLMNYQFSMDASDRDYCVGHKNEGGKNCVSGTNTIDSSGNRRHGTWFNVKKDGDWFPFHQISNDVPTTLKTEKVDRFYASFTKTGSVKINNVAIMLPHFEGNAEFTYEGWVKPNTSIDTWMWYVTENGWIRLRKDSVESEIYACRCGGEDKMMVTWGKAALSAGNWYHLAVAAKSNGYSDIYVNGNPVAIFKTQTWDHGGVYYTDLIGAHPDGNKGKSNAGNNENGVSGGAYMKAQLAEHRVWNYKRSSEQIKADYKKQYAPGPKHGLPRSTSSLGTATAAFTTRMTLPTPSSLTTWERWWTPPGTAGTGSTGGSPATRRSRP